MSYEEVGRNNTSAGSEHSKDRQKRGGGERVKVGLKGNDVCRRRYAVHFFKLKWKQVSFLTKLGDTLTRAFAFSRLKRRSRLNKLP